MLDPKLLRSDLDGVAKALARRGFTLDTARLAELEVPCEEGLIIRRELAAGDVDRAVGNLNEAAAIDGAGYPWPCGVYVDGQGFEKTMMAMETTLGPDGAKWSLPKGTDDEMAALSLGVSARFVYAAAWAIAFMAAGVGGTLLGNINGLNISVGYLGLLVLPAVVLGGLNSVPGAIVGGITIGILQNLCGAYLDKYFPGGIKEIAPFAFMAIFLLFKPHGLWGWERIERV